MKTKTMTIQELLDRIEQRFLQDNVQKDFEATGMFRARLDNAPESVAADTEFQAFVERMAARGCEVKHDIEPVRPAGAPPEAAEPHGVLRIIRAA